MSRGSRHDRARDRADAHLERRPVGDQVRDVLADPALDLADRRVGVLVGRHVDLDAEVDLGDVDEAVAEGPGHRRLSWAMTVLPQRTAASIASTDVPSEQKPCSSGGVTLMKHGVERQHARVEQERDVRQEDRDELGPALVDRLCGRWGR